MNTAHKKKEQEDDRYRLCPRCGNFAHISQPDVYCIVCGEQLITECRYCGQPIRYPTAKFCPVCGEGYEKPEITGI